MPKITDNKKNERRDLILNHALELFGEKGFNETSMNDIVQSTGISKGGIYVYFKSKDEIFLAIAEMVTLKRHHILLNFQGKSYKEKLNYYIQEVISSYRREENFKRIKFTFEFWLKHSRSEKIGSYSKKEILNNKFEFYSKDIRDILVGGIESGEFKENIDLDSIPYIILTSIDGMAFASQMLCNPITQGKIITFSDMVINSILK